MNKKKYIRQNFRNEVFQRDNFKCVFCDEKDNLDAHHITDRSLMPNGGYVKENGITLCQKEHHMMAEEYHISNHKKWFDDMHPDDLYKIINSSLELAVEKSKLL